MKQNTSTSNLQQSTKRVCADTLTMPGWTKK